MAVALMSAYEALRVTTQRPVIDKYVSEVRKELLSMCARAHDITSAWLELAKDEVQYRAWCVGMGGQSGRGLHVVACSPTCCVVCRVDGQRSIWLPTAAIWRW